MSKFVLIRDNSAGNESIGEMWKETKAFDGSATLDEVAQWAFDLDKYQAVSHSRKNVVITMPHDEVDS